MRLVKIVALSNNESSKKIMKLYIKEFYKDQLKIEWLYETRYKAFKSGFGCVFDLNFIDSLKSSGTYDKDFANIIKFELEFDTCLEPFNPVQKRCEITSEEFAKLCRFIREKLSKRPQL